LSLVTVVMRGLFITLEGIDGCGKSTQRELLAAALGKRGLDVITTREPGGTPLGERIRALLSSASHGMSAKTELLLIVAARAQHVAELILPSLEAGRTVISDRYTDSSLAFQGYGRGLDLSMIDEMNRFATGGLAPDLTILFDLDTELARSRLDARSVIKSPGPRDSELSYLDDLEAAFHRRVRDGYLKLQQAESERIHLVGAGGTIEAAHQQVMSLIDNLKSNYA
jgi:dTMP kinase